MPPRFSHVIGIDDAPFPPTHRGDVPIIGTAFSGLRLEGILRAKVRRDGTDSTRAIAQMVSSSRFAPHTRLVVLEGISLAGFNVVDLHALHATLGMAVLVVVKRMPDIDAVRRALLERVRGGARKWALIEKAGPMEPLGGLFVQRAGIEPAEALDVIRTLAVHGRLPEPVRVAHLVASVLAVGSA
ncbi:DUF99 family protein [Polyangium aurulentum]|uniref:endonuclease dU n=1 Tax=Polyangium aurulentum TaxID=2567896 RepID=UPI0010ADFBEC|nr:DUF99 family protein [Polyangium aurulentum]UQA54614.1 DUF99 family protein [Polyangium aurulentum]